MIGSLTHLVSVSFGFYFHLKIFNLQLNTTLSLRKGKKGHDMLLLTMHSKWSAVMAITSMSLIWLLLQDLCNFKEEFLEICKIHIGRFWYCSRACREHNTDTSVTYTCEPTWSNHTTSYGRVASVIIVYVTWSNVAFILTSTFTVITQCICMTVMWRALVVSPPHAALLW